MYYFRSHISYLAGVNIQAEAALRGFKQAARIIVVVCGRNGIVEMSQRKFWGKDGIFINPVSESVKLRGFFYSPSSALMEFWHLEGDADSRN